ncbi:uncharacterized protein B0H18DRAFT_973746 [Fomitopsis serialis]|uniref:uncharacterized protein n=1 Tax=Fomitopsis serialis TaxID=139415 RepID=UPI00200720D9|nr:uncharacterized protein B0H18DRAFT_973746 [Neoantrodia serialis]KAH9936408.1 hypothetical protein B0H18DRAFT_973746 [Neoantrodia serialis]
MRLYSRRSFVSASGFNGIYWGVGSVTVAPRGMYHTHLLYSLARQRTRHPAERSPLPER